MITPETFDLDPQTTIVSTLQLHQKMVRYSNWITFLFIKWLVYIAPMIIMSLYFQTTPHESFAIILFVVYVCFLIYIITCLRHIFKIMTGPLFEWSTHRLCCVCNESLSRYHDRLNITITFENCQEMTNDIQSRIRRFKRSLLILCIIEFLWWITIIGYIVIYIAVQK
jgi:hypothetical protein